VNTVPVNRLNGVLSRGLLVVCIYIPLSVSKAFRSRSRP
jgi:hypothetical protein